MSAQARCIESNVTSPWSSSFTIDIEDDRHLAVWKDPQNTLWIVGKEGQCTRLSLSSNERHEEKIGSEDLRGVWGQNEQKVFCVGKYGTVLSYDGGAWQKHDVGTLANLNHVAGMGEKVWIVGNQGTILHLQENGWKKQNTPTTADLYALWGHTPESVFAVGAGGTILHYDGEAWQILSAPTQEDLQCLWAENDTNVWVAGKRGTILHFDGGSWEKIPCEENISFHSIQSVEERLYFVSKEGIFLRMEGGLLRNQSSQKNIAGLFLDDARHTLHILHYDLSISPITIEKD